MTRRILIFLRAETGGARADYAVAFVLTTLGQQIVTHGGGPLGDALRPVFAYLG